MPNKDGTITLKDIITEEALKFGEKYKAQAEIAINANESLLKSAKALNESMGMYRTSNNNANLVEAKNKEKNAIDGITQALKAQQLAMKDLNDERERQLALERAMDAVTKARLRTNADTKKAIDEEKIAHVQNMNAIKQEAEAEIAKERAKREALKTENAVANAAKRNATLTAEERVQNEILNKAKKQQARENLGLVGAYEKLNKSRTEAQKRLADLLAAEDKDIQKIKQAQKEYDELNKKVREVDNAVDIFTKNIGNYQSGFSGLGEAISSLVAAFGVGVGIASFTDALRAAFEIVKNYEAEVVNLAAIAGKTREEIGGLEATIQDVAAASVNSATDVAKLATELIKLGSTPEEAEKLLKPVNDLSLALRASAEDAATLVKSLLNAYGEGAQEAARYTDVLAESANRSALDFEGLRDAFSYIAPTARTLGFSLEKTASLIGILADNGIKAESAGRLLATGLGKIADSGLTLEDALDKINEKQKQGADSLEILSTANGLFGVEAGKLALILANNREKIDEMTQAYENSQGSLEELTNKQLKSLDAQLKILDSSFEDYILKTNESTGASRTLTNIVKFLSDNLGLMIDTLVSAVAIYATYRTTILLTNLATKAMTVSTNAMTVATALAKNGIAGARAEMQALNVATKVNPFAAIVTGVVALAFYLGGLTRSLKETTAEVDKSTAEFLKSKEVQDKNIQSITNMTRRYEELDGKLNRTKEEQRELNELTKTLGEIVPDATKKVNQYGEAIQLSGDKLREYIKLQKETMGLRRDVELEKNTKLLERQRKELELLTRADEENGISEVKTGAITFMEVTRQNGVLKTRNTVFGRWRELNKEEQLAYKEQRLNAEQQIATTNARIKALKGLEDQTKKTNAATGDSAGSTQPGERTIAVIDAEIKAEKDKIDSLTYTTRQEGVLIDKKIAALQKERDAIYSTQKSIKDLDKARQDALNAQKKIDEDAYNLAVFRLNRLKAQNDEIIEDIDETQQSQIDAEIRNQQILLALNEEATEKKLKDISRYNDKVRDLTDAEINTLLNGGTIKKKLNNEEKLALEQFFAQKEAIYLKSEEKIDNIQVTKFEKRLKDRTRELEAVMNQDIIRENDRFANERIEEGKREEAVERHEKKIAEIKRQYAMKGLADQIAAMENLLKTEEVSGEKRKEIESQLSDAKREYSDLATNNAVDNNKKEVLSEEDKAEKIKDLSLNLKDSLVDLADAIFDARLSKIDDEISKTEDFYNKQIELAGEDQRKKDLLEKEAEKKRVELEKKKREEQRKQAIFNKALKITDIGIATALGIMQSYAQLGPIAGNIGAILVSAAGAIQLAAVLAAPIPKYKGGRKGGPKEVAWLGDGFVKEVIEDKKGNIRLTPNKPTLMQLEEGDTVHSSEDAYRRHVRNTVLASASREKDRVTRIYSTIESKKTDKDFEFIEKAIDKGFRKAKIVNNNNMPKQDIPHSIWAYKNTNW